MWAELRPEVVEVVKAHIDSADYDRAIFEAFKTLESNMQGRLGSGSIGRSLIGLAFVEHRVRLTNDDRDQASLNEFFSGTLSFYRGDRAHKTRPSFPVTSESVCLRILAIVSAQFDLLDSDQGVQPVVLASELANKTLRIQCQNTSLETACVIDGAEAAIARRSGQELMIRLARDMTVGEHSLVLRDGEREGPEFLFYVGRETEYGNWYRVLEYGVGLFEDKECKTPRSEVGVLLLSHEGGREFVRCLPVAREYKAGDYVTWEWLEPRGSVVGKSWYRDADTDEIRLGWLSSTLFNGVPTSPTHEPRAVAVELHPRGALRLRPGDTIKTRALGKVSDGGAVWNRPLSAREVDFSSADESVAHVDESGVVRAKGFGSTVLTSSIGNRYSRVKVEVGGQLSGYHYPILSGFQHPTGVAWSESRGLLFCSRSDDLQCLSNKFELQTVVKFPDSNSSIGGLDSVAVDSAGNIYVRNVARRAVLVALEPNFATIHEIRLPTRAVPMSLDTTENGAVIVDSDGSAWAFDLASKIVTHLATSPRGGSGGYALTDVAATSAKVFFIDNQARIFSLEQATGASMQEVEFSGAKATFSSVTTLGEDLILTDFNGGRLLRLSGGVLEVVASGFESPTDAAVYQGSNIAVANFGSSVISVVPL